MLVKKAKKWNTDGRHDAYTCSASIKRDPFLQFPKFILLTTLVLGTVWMTGITFILQQAKLNGVAAVQLVLADIDEKDNKEPCALLFFGVVKHFNSVVLPSIKANVIEPNQGCDIFLHTYNLTQIPHNKRNGETEPTLMDATEAYFIADATHVDNESSDITTDIAIESMESFHTQRADVLQRTRKNYHHGWGACCTSHDNMIKQWHSIQGAWTLMRKHEKKMTSLRHHDKRIRDGDSTSYYKQVGLFRSDVLYTQPIHIHNTTAVVPSFSSWFGYNDRLFYGKRTHAETWASKRFEFIPEFETRYMINNTGDFSHGYHSETYLKRLFKHYEVPVKAEKICVLRVRAGPAIAVHDCLDYAEFNSLKNVTSTFPKELQNNIKLVGAHRLHP